MGVCAKRLEAENMDFIMPGLCSNDYNCPGSRIYRKLNCIAQHTLRDIDSPAPGIPGLFRNSRWTHIWIRKRHELEHPLCCSTLVMIIWQNGIDELDVSYVIEGKAKQWDSSALCRRYDRVMHLHDKPALRCRFLVRLVVLRDKIWVRVSHWVVNRDCAGAGWNSLECGPALFQSPRIYETVVVKQIAKRISPLMCGFVC